MNLFTTMKTMSWTPTENNICEYVLKNYKEIPTLTIRELAERTFSSSSAITRFCRKLGVDGYAEFKLKLASQLHFFEQPLVVEEILPLRKYDTAYQTMEKIATIQQKAILETTRELDYGNVQKLVLKLMSCEKVHFFGLGLNYYIAQEFRYLFERLGKKVKLYENKNDRIIQVMNAKKGDVAFILSHTGKEKEQYELATRLKQKGVLIVSMSGDEESLISKIADFYFYIKPGRRFVDLGNVVFATSTRHILYVIYGYLFTLCYENKKEEFELYAKIANYETDYQ